MPQALIFSDTNGTRGNYSTSLFNNGTDLQQILSNHFQHSALFISVLVVIVCMAFTGNVIVLVAWFQKNIPTRIIYFYTCNLAWSDLIMTVAVAVNPLNRYYMTGAVGNIACKLNLFTIHASTTASFSTLTAISFTRYKKMTSPSTAINQQLEQQEKKLARKRCYCIWLIAVIISSPLLSIYTGQTINNGGNACVAENWPVAYIKLYFSLYLLLFFILPLLLLIFVSYRIYCILQNHTLTNQPNSIQYSTSGKSHNLLDRTRVLFVIVVVFLICIGPMSVARAIEPNLEFSPKVPREFVRIMQFLFLLNSAINPFIYWAFSTEIRDGCKQSLKNLWIKYCNPYFNSSSGVAGSL